MKLQTKFNLSLSAAFVVGLALAAIFALKISNDTARRDVLHEAALMASEGEGASSYTDQEVAPLLSKIFAVHRQNTQNTNSLSTIFAPPASNGPGVINAEANMRRKAAIMRMRLT